jgi:hypothetical protein
MTQTQFELGRIQGHYDREGECQYLRDVIKSLREALQKIASCKSHAPGDVVDIAREALK